MALTGFPVGARQIFLAKFGALVLLFTAFVLSLTAPLAEKAGERGALVLLFTAFVLSLTAPLAEKPGERGALVLLFTAFVLSLTAPLAGFFGFVIRGPWQENPSGAVLGAATFAALADRKSV